MARLKKGMSTRYGKRGQKTSPKQSPATYKQQGFRESPVTRDLDPKKKKNNNRNNKKVNPEDEYSRFDDPDIEQEEFFTSDEEGFDDSSSDDEENDGFPVAQNKEIDIDKQQQVRKRRRAATQSVSNISDASLKTYSYVWPRFMRFYEAVYSRTNFEFDMGAPDALVTFLRLSAGHMFEDGQIKFHEIIQPDDPNPEETREKLKKLFPINAPSVKKSTFNNYINGLRASITQQDGYNESKLGYHLDPFTNRWKGNPMDGTDDFDVPLLARNLAKFSDKNCDTIARRTSPVLGRHMKYWKIYANEKVMPCTCGRVDCKPMASHNESERRHPCEYQNRLAINMAFSLSFFCCLRMNETLNIRDEDVSYHKETATQGEHFAVLIRNRKTDRYRTTRGQLYRVFNLQDHEPDIDAFGPLKKWRDWKRASQDYQNATTEKDQSYLLPDISYSANMKKAVVNYSGQMSAATITKVIKRWMLLANRAQNEDTDINPGQHGFRRGGAQYRCFESPWRRFTISECSRWCGWADDEHQMTIAYYLVRCKRSMESTESALDPKFNKSREGLLVNMKEKTPDQLYCQVSLHTDFNGDSKEIASVAILAVKSIRNPQELIDMISGSDVLSKKVKVIADLRLHQQSESQLSDGLPISHPAHNALVAAHQQINIAPSLSSTIQSGLGNRSTDTISNANHIDNTWRTQISEAASIVAPFAMRQQEQPNNIRKTNSTHIVEEPMSHTINRMEMVAPGMRASNEENVRKSIISGSPVPPPRSLKPSFPSRISTLRDISGGTPHRIYHIWYNGHETIAAPLKVEYNRLKKLTVEGAKGLFQTGDGQKLKTYKYLVDFIDLYFSGTFDGGSAWGEDARTIFLDALWNLKSDNAFKKDYLNMLSAACRYHLLAHVDGYDGNEGKNMKKNTKGYYQRLCVELQGLGSCQTGKERNLSAVKFTVERIKLQSETTVNSSGNSDYTQTETGSATYKVKAEKDFNKKQSTHSPHNTHTQPPQKKPKHDLEVDGETTAIADNSGDTLPTRCEIEKGIPYYRHRLLSAMKRNQLDGHPNRTQHYWLKLILYITRHKLPRTKYHYHYITGTMQEVFKRLIQEGVVLEETASTNGNTSQEVSLVLKSEHLQNIHPCDGTYLEDDPQLLFDFEWEISA